MNIDHPITLRPDKAADYLGLSKQRLAELRLRGSGPRYAKIGSTVHYLREDLDAWVRLHLRTSTSDHGYQPQSGAA